MEQPFHVRSIRAIGSVVFLAKAEMVQGMSTICHVEGEAEK
jgi:hypothetical protein